MKLTNKDHTFVICAYQESPYLEQCILSLKKQSVKSNIIMVTSTNTELIQKMAQKYKIPLYINTGEKGITQDWNFGIDKADTPLVTIAHQDDVYCRDFTEQVLKKANTSKRPLLIFTDYGELRDGNRVKNNRLLKIKRMMLIPLECPMMAGSRLVRRRILSFGSPISCPTVTYYKPNLLLPVFEDGFTCSEDWQAWEKISKLHGDFLYCKELLVYHRIHRNSTTSKMIQGTGRSVEDYLMFLKFWPVPIARLLTKCYAYSEKSNEL